MRTRSEAEQTFRNLTYSLSVSPSLVRSLGGDMAIFISRLTEHGPFKLGEWVDCFATYIEEDLGYSKSQQLAMLDFLVENDIIKYEETTIRACPVYRILLLKQTKAVTNRFTNQSDKVIEKFVENFSYQTLSVSPKLITPEIIEFVIYFLLKNGIVVYIGQSNNFHQRLLEHVESRKEFDAYLLLTYDFKTNPFELKKKRNYLEHLMIKKFKPLYNTRSKI